MGTAFKFINEEWVEVETTTNADYKMCIDGVVVESFVTTYLPIKGHTAVLMSWEDFEGMPGTYTPWNTWLGNETKEQAWKDALEWAMAEDIPAIKG